LSIEFVVGMTLTPVMQWLHISLATVLYAARRGQRPVFSVRTIGNVSVFACGYRGKSLFPVDFVQPAVCGRSRGQQHYILFVLASQTRAGLQHDPTSFTLNE